jgi:hypothetical protein|tara:strand:- start:53 stop:328 length:276 start_codon:yes stop_codon:yes gene_type:complete
MKQAIELMLNLVGKALGIAAYLSPEIRARYKNADLYISAVTTATYVYEELQKAQSADSDGGEAVTKEELLAIIGAATESLGGLMQAVEESK